MNHQGKIAMGMKKATKFTVFALAAFVVVTFIWFKFPHHLYLKKQEVPKAPDTLPANGAPNITRGNGATSFPFGLSKTNSIDARRLKRFK
jgi:hypothetical protein